MKLSSYNYFHVSGGSEDNKEASEVSEENMDDKTPAMTVTELITELYTETEKFTTVEDITKVEDLIVA